MATTTTMSFNSKTEVVKMRANTDDSPTTKFALSTKECFNKGWVSSPDGSLQKSLDEIISSIQTSISDCLRSFKSHANDRDKTLPTDYVVWRFGDSRRITAAKFTKFSNIPEEHQTLNRAEQIKKSLKDREVVQLTPVSGSASERGSITNVPPKSFAIGTPLLYQNVTPDYTIRQKVKWSLPGSISRHSKLLQGTWATDVPVLRVCTSSCVDTIYYSSNRLAILICRDPITNGITNGFVYDDNGAMLATCSQDRYVTCYKPGGVMWFHATIDGGRYFDYTTNELKSWFGAPPWNNKNVLELQLNKIVALRFKGLSDFTLIYRSQIDNLYVKVKPPEDKDDMMQKKAILEEFLEEPIVPPKTDNKKLTRVDLNLQDIVKCALVEKDILKSKFDELKSVQRNISALFKKIDTLFSSFFHLQFSKDAATAISTEPARPSLKMEYPTKVREIIICPLILRQQIIYQRTRLEAAAAQGIEVKPSLTTKTWLQCNCSSTETPILSDLECQEYIENRSPSKQMLIICIINSKIGTVEVEEMLSDIYHTQNRKHKKPCIQLPLDSYRLLKYDIATADSSTGRTIPWLVEKYQVVHGMVMMFLKSQLLFCNFNFNGYGVDQHNFMKQIRRSFDLARKGKHLPSDFKFGLSFLEPSTDKSSNEVSPVSSQTEL